MQDVLTLKIDTSEVIKQIEGLEEIVHYYHCIPILIEGIKAHMQEPFRSKILAEWDNQRDKKGNP